MSEVHQHDDAKARFSLHVWRPVLSRALSQRAAITGLIGAGVFVAEAGRDLEIAVEARHHQQLLEHLRRLGKRIEFAGVHAAGHQIIARAFRAAGGEDRRLEFHEALIDHAATHTRNHIGAQHNVVVQTLTTQIEEAIAQADVFRIFRIAEYGHRKLLRGGLKRHFTCADFNLTRRQICIHGFSGTRHDFAGHRDNGFGAGLFKNFEGFGVDVRDDLGQAIMVSQIHEKQIAMIPLAVNPAGKADG